MCSKEEKVDDDDDDDDEHNVPNSFQKTSLLFEHLPNFGRNNTVFQSCARVIQWIRLFSQISSWDLTHPFISGCFNWIIPNPLHGK